MIDTDKYEGHTPGQWSVTSIRDGSIPWNTADEELCADAPLLLAEVKRLYEWIERAGSMVAQSGYLLNALTEKHEATKIFLEEVFEE
tara:strand:- start:1420 stop:1680 length:261 start_codon:yes stop_codon:yes gene_type:complete